MQTHHGQLKCLALSAPICSAVTECRIDFDEKSVVLHMPEGWRTVLRDQEIRFCCPACWKALTVDERNHGNRTTIAYEAKS